MNKLIKVFISYAHESDDFKQKVHELTSWLKENGEAKIVIESDYNYMYKAPKSGWQIWMQDQVEESDIVLVICSPKYLKRFRKTETPKIGRGAIFEGAIITQELYDAQSENEKYIPIIPDGGSIDDVPTILKPFFNYLSFPTDNDKILKSILNELPASREGDYTLERKLLASNKYKIYQEFFDFFLLYKNSDPNIINNFIHRRSLINDSQLIDKILSLLVVLEAYNSSNVNDTAQKKYHSILFDNKMTSNDSIDHIIDKASHYVKELEFDKAHMLFSDALKQADWNEPRYNFLYKEYLTTGFIRYSRDNDITGLRSLLHTKSKVEIDKNSDIGYIISLIYQEIFTRDIDLDGLRDAVSSLNTLYDKANPIIKSAMANSLGLSYRRLGERTGISDLKKAIAIFKEGLEINKEDETMELELKDQMAITHVRIFEFNKDEIELKNAETLLQDCLKILEKPLHPKYYRLKPRVLNNYGNVHKQRLLKLKDIESAPKAIACYEEAQEYWNEKNANYDWALLMKNIAETKYALGIMTGDVGSILQALKESIKSTRYRTLKNSPYQWGRSVEIAFSAVVTLNETQSVKKISKLMRNKILLSSQTICQDEMKWRKNFSDQFVQIAKKTEDILKNG